MQPLELTADLITGIPALDAQHRDLLTLANEVVYAPDNDVDPDVFNLAVSFLQSYIVYHFAAEETLMTELGYPDRELHFDLHGRLQRKVAELADRVRQVGVSRALRAEVSLMLEDWLVYHIRESDREMARFIREQPVDVATLTLAGVESLKNNGAIPADFDDRIAAGILGKRLAEADQGPRAIR
jgi:hemerythrin-like metal-binding protein